MDNQTYRQRYRQSDIERDKQIDEQMEKGMEVSRAEIPNECTNFKYLYG